MKSFMLFLSFAFLGTGVNSQTLQADILNYTNQLRKANGKTALLLRDDLNVIAQQHSVNMAQGKTEFGHDGFEEREKKALVSIPSLKAMAENVAYGPKTGKEVVAMWTESKGHKKNMLGNYRYIGIGVASSPSGQLYYTQVFVN